MSWSTLAANQMVTELDAAGGPFQLYPGQSHGTTLRCMTKSDATTKYSLLASNLAAYASNQLIPKSVWTDAGIDVTLPTGAVTYVSLIRTTTSTLTWDTYADNYGVTGFKVYSYNGTSWVLITTLGMVTSYNLTGLSATTGYEYKVMAVDAAGNISVTGLSSGWITAINPPTSVLASSPTTTTVNLSWTKSNGPWPGTNHDATTQYIYVNGTLHDTISGSLSSYQVTGLSSSTSYSFYLTAAGYNGNSGWESDNSNTATATTTASGTPHTVYWYNEVDGVGLYNNFTIQVNGIIVVNNTTYGSATGSGSFTVYDGDELSFVTEGLTGDYQWQQLTLTEGANYLTFMNTNDYYPYTQDTATIYSSYASTMYLHSYLTFG